MIPVAPFTGQNVSILLGIDFLENDIVVDMYKLNELTVKFEYVATEIVSKKETPLHFDYVVYGDVSRETGFNASQIAFNPVIAQSYQTHGKITLQ